MTGVQTCALPISFPFFLVSHAHVRFAGPCHVMGWAFGLPGLVLSYYTAIAYVPKMRANLLEGRAQRARAVAA